MEPKNENRTDKFLKNVVGSAVLQIVTIITGFISPKLMLSAFGSEVNGITTSITQFISYIALVEAGLSNATIFALYKPLANGDVKERDAIVHASKIAYNRTGFLFVGLSVILALVYPILAETSVMSDYELALLVLVLCSNTTISFFVLSKYRTLLTADQCGYVISYTSSLQLIAHLVIIILAIKAGFHVIIVRALGICSMFLTSISLAIVVKCRYGKINFKEKPNMKALDKRWDAMFLQVLGVVATGAPVVIMTAILDFKLISVYAVYNMIAGSVNHCISVFTSGLSATFGNIYAIGDKNLLRKTTQEFRTAFYILITIVYTVMLATLMPFIVLYTEGIQDVNYYIPVFGVLITLKGLLDNFRAPHGMLVYSLGKFKIIKRQTVVQALMIIAGGIAFTKWWGLNGMMISLCIANTYMLVELLIITPRELVDMSITKNVRQIVQSLSIVMVIYLCVNKVGYQPASYLEWLIYACVVGMVSVASAVFVFAILDRDDVICLWKRVCVYIKRSK